MILMKNIEYLVINAETEEIHVDAWLLVEGKHVLDYGTGSVQSDLFERCDVEIVDCKGKIVMPGFIDAHNHLADQPYYILPGVDPSSMEYTDVSDCLEKLMWPAYVWASEESTYDLTLLALVNSIRHGTTTVTSAFPYPESACEAGIKADMRVIAHPQSISNVRFGDQPDDESYLKNTEECIVRYHNANDGLIQVSVHPHTMFSCSERLIMDSMALARKHDVQFVTHLLESEEDRTKSDIKYEEFGGVIPYMAKKGLLDRNTLLFHCSYMSEEEMDTVAEYGANIVHCPLSNASFFGDVANVLAMHNRGIHVGMGCDQPSGKMSDQIFAASTFHAIVPQGMERILPANKPIEMATIGGAKALNMDDQIGSLERGKCADLISINLKENENLFPLHKDVLLYNLALWGAGVEVNDTMVNGKFLLRDKVFIELETEQIYQNASSRIDEFITWYMEKKEKNERIVEYIFKDYEFK